MVLLDYIFYRIYSFYKKSKDAVPIFMGCGVLTTMLFFSLLSLIVIINFVFKITIPINKIIICFTILSFLVAFGKRFNNDEMISSLEEKYAKEDDYKKRRNAFFIALYILIVFLMPILYGFLKHNLKMDI